MNETSRLPYSLIIYNFIETPTFRRPQSPAQSEPIANRVSVISAPLCGKYPYVTDKGHTAYAPLKKAV